MNPWTLHSIIHEFINKRLSNLTVFVLNCVIELTNRVLYVTDVFNNR